MEIRIAGIQNDSIVDGPGFRMAIFTQGCPHACPGCHNPETHSIKGGRVIDTGDIVAAMRDNPLLDGITLTGGDPFCQPEACALIAGAAHDMGLTVWAYSGWTYEQLFQKAEDQPAVRELLNQVDVLVDGLFVIAQRTLEKRFRGSKNQRLINVPASLKRGEAVIVQEE